MAEYMIVPDGRFLVRLGKLDPKAAAPLTDAALTPYHAIKSVLPALTPDSYGSHDWHWRTRPYGSADSAGGVGCAPCGGRHQ